ncbi:hypothetical protein BJ878DRAFT_296841 [Calycina marina]|uniref:Transcription initiation factor TFIID subunit 13 n=1 Tax=Calycina marina TaxID=1763456 RepID=A0A9P7Z796_9HELO|nr:hypothetical protein BJ878DRAFT_296841 [Calycina marina]
MEPRARASKISSSQQQFTDGELEHMLWSHGDVRSGGLDTTKNCLSEIANDFITELSWEAHRAAQLAGRQKIKLEDVKFACRKNPVFLGKIEEMFTKKAEIDEARKMVNPNDDKITKSAAKDMGVVEEPLGDADDDVEESRAGRGRSTGR